MRALNGFKAESSTDNCFWILRQIKAITLQFDEKRHGVLSLCDARENLLTCRQRQDQSVAEYKEILKGWADAIIFHGGTVAKKPGAVPLEDEDGNILCAAECELIAREQTLAMLLIRGADPSLYGSLIELSNHFSMGR